MAPARTQGLRIGFAVVLLLTVGTQADAQERAGVVTTLQGTVTVMRASLTEPAPLRFRDDIFVRDRIATGDDSLARVLLGGKAVVTVREHSVVTITEAPGRSTIDVAAGRAAVAVARERMRPGDLVEVKTPNAVAGIRGTVIVAEVLDADRSIITVLKGLIDVTRLEHGRAVGHPTFVRALQRVRIARGTALPAPETLLSDAARDLGREFRVAPPRPTVSAATVAVNQAEMRRAARELASVLPSAVESAGERHGGKADDSEVDDTRRGRKDPGDKVSEPTTAVAHGPKGAGAEAAASPALTTLPSSASKGHGSAAAGGEAAKGGGPRGGPKPGHRGK